MTTQDDYMLINLRSRRAVKFVGDSIQYCKATPNFQRCLPVWPEAVEIADQDQREKAAQAWLSEAKAYFAK